MLSAKRLPYSPPGRWHSMALEAIDRATGDLVKLWKMSDDAIRELIIETNKDAITCNNQDCNCRMYIKALDSDNRVTHFARYPKTGTDKYHPTSGGESLEHLMIKERLAKWLQNRYPGAEITTEYFIAGDMIYKNTRRIDVFVTHHDGTKEAHEIQLSPQPTATTARRTRDYKSFGIDEVVWWWAGRNSYNEAYGNWCIENCNYYGTAETRNEIIMGHKLLTDVKFSIYDCEAIRHHREMKLVEWERQTAEKRERQREAEMEWQTRVAEAEKAKARAVLPASKYNAPLKPGDDPANSVAGFDIGAEVSPCDEPGIVRTVKRIHWRLQGEIWRLWYELTGRQDACLIEGLDGKKLPVLFRQSELRSNQ